MTRRGRKRDKGYINGVSDNYFNLGKPKGIPRACDYMMDNHPKLWNYCFSLDENRYENRFTWHKCDCGLPTIICNTQEKQVSSPSARSFVIWCLKSIFPPSNDFYSYLEDGKVHIVYRYPHNPEDEWNDCKNIYSDTEVKASVQPEVSSRR